MSYNQFSASERLYLYQLRTTTDLSLRAIAKQMGRNQSTLSRELQRNQVSSDIYLPDTAQPKTLSRRQQSKTAFSGISEACLHQIKQRLEQYHSPEQIAGRLKRAGQEYVSHETIYKMIYCNYQSLGQYQKYLRLCRGCRRRRGSRKSSRGQIPGRIGIEHRPEIANQKTQMGHWESDTVIGGNHNGILVTHVDKASKFLVAGLAKNKTVQQVNQVTIELFCKIPKSQRVTMTFDNGKEFSGHEELAKTLEVSCYFANPYHDWERGLNEPTNGLIRQFFPKQTNFRIIKSSEVEKVVSLINNRPRKSLDYRTPYEVFYSNTSDTDALQI